MHPSVSPAAAAAPDRSPDPLFVSFSIRALAEPGVMPRVLELFAKRGLVPQRWNSVVSEAGLGIDVQMTGLDRDMAVSGEGDEIALRIDHDLLDLAGAALEHAAQQVRFARARIALHEQPGREQFFEIDANRFARAVCPHVYLKRHAGAHGGWGCEEASV